MKVVVHITGGSVLMAVLSNVLSHTASYLSPQCGFEFLAGHVRKPPVTRGKAVTDLCGQTIPNFCNGEMCPSS